MILNCSWCLYAVPSFKSNLHSPMTNFAVPSAYTSISPSCPALKSGTPRSFFCFLFLLLLFVALPAPADVLFPPLLLLFLPAAVALFLFLPFLSFANGKSGGNCHATNFSPLDDLKSSSVCAIDSPFFLLKPFFSSSFPFALSLSIFAASLILIASAFFCASNTAKSMGKYCFLSVQSASYFSSASIFRLSSKASSSSSTSI
mmetsp:Transcript_976/g.3061  ORF Transcript_976/g.3061 Transcript_976/m.3061 type:complete len:202 (+) Transcript_976:291-896(+)